MNVKLDEIIVGSNSGTLTPLVPHETDIKCLLLFVFTGRFTAPDAQRGISGPGDPQCGWVPGPGEGSRHPVASSFQYQRDCINKFRISNEQHHPALCSLPPIMTDT